MEFTTGPDDVYLFLNREELPRPLPNATVLNDRLCELADAYAIAVQSGRQPPRTVCLSEVSAMAEELLKRRFDDVLLRTNGKIFR